MNGVGSILLGLGEGLQGRGADFINKREVLEQKMKDREAARQKTMFTDALGMLDLAKKGRFDLASQFAKNRLDTGKQYFPYVDWSDSQQWADIAGYAAQGNQEAQKMLIDTLSNQVEIGRAMDVLPQLPGDKFIKAEDGQALVQTPTGEFEARDIKGFKGDPLKALQRNKIVLEIENKQLANEKARRDLNNLSGKSLSFDDKRKVQSDISKIIKEPSEIRSAAARLSKLSETKSVTDKLAAIFTFMKALDPTSVVRESEQGMVVAAGGLGSQMTGFFNQLSGSGKLDPEVFDEMVLTAKRLANQAIDDGRIEAIALLDAFGQDMPEDFRNKTMGRLPKLFEVGNATSDTKPSASPPASIDPKDWEHMTPEDRKLFNGTN